MPLSPHTGANPPRSYHVMNVSLRTWGRAGAAPNRNRHGSYKSNRGAGVNDHNTDVDPREISVRRVKLVGTQGPLRKRLLDFEDEAPCVGPAGRLAGRVRSGALCQDSRDVSNAG